MRHAPAWLRLSGAVVVIGTLAFTACERYASPTPTPTSELAGARAKWAASGATDYAVESRILCFCPGQFAVWTRLSVRNDRVDAADALEPLPPGSFNTVSGWRTVQQLFDEIERRTNDPSVANLAVRYHPTLGYPERIAVTCRPDIIDCGVTYELRNLAR